MSQQVAQAAPHHGGGVKTEEGKVISSKNAMKHGLLSREVLLEGEDAKTLQELRQSVISDFDPQGEMEHFLVDSLISDMWRLRRAIAVESACGESARKRSHNRLFELEDSTKEEKEAAAVAATFSDGRSEKVLRYLTSIQRSFYRTLHEVQRLQAARKGESVPIPAVLDVNMDGQSPFSD